MFKGNGASRTTLLRLSFLSICTTTAVFVVSTIILTEIRKGPSWGQLSNTVLRSGHTRTAQTVPLILLYNPFFGLPNWNCRWAGLGDSKVVQMLENCPTTCHFAFDSYFQRSADFVLVSLSGFQGWGGKRPDRNFSKQDQVWTSYHFDPPPHPWGQGYDMVDDQFEWVASYRRDADIFAPFGRFLPLATTEASNQSLLLDDLRRSLRGKKMAAWLVSNCGVFPDAMARQLLVENLQRFIPVDVFGKCSGRECPGEDDTECRRYLGLNYKFYLAFENSLCVDYVTEKFFTSLLNDMVPVVFGWAEYPFHAPPGSYINALEYDSVEKLAEYLQYLDQNEDEYLKYFAWRSNWTVQSLWDMELTMCSICEKMHDRLNAVQGTEEQGLRGPQRNRYPSYQKWHESFPVDSMRSPTFRVGQHMISNITTACVRYDEHPELVKWLNGD